MKEHQVWFVIGSQHLYGEETLKKVAANGRIVADHLNGSPHIPVGIRYRGVVTTAKEITQAIEEANNDSECVGLMAWMHTFSPAKMWIQGLKILNKPMLHLHTQMNTEIPWDNIDMDFMNLNQSAHGDREFGFICTRLGIRRKVVCGHWTSESVQKKIGNWGRVAVAIHDARTLKVARFGDNMRDVAVTEGDKVEAQTVFGYSVHGFGVGDLSASIQAVEEKAIDVLIEEYRASYRVSSDLLPGGRRGASLREAARIESGLENFLKAGSFRAFTTTFEDLHGLEQLPGLAVQRLMAKGYGFGAEGDWKTSALVRNVKVMTEGLQGGTSFMEDYTYHFSETGDLVLGAHMLEVCPSIATSEKPKLEVHPLGIGGKADPVRLVFNSRPGPAINASLIDLGDRFRLIVNEVEAIDPTKDLPRLPVARTVWRPKPNLETAASAWIYAGGAHHTVYSQAIDSSYLEDFADFYGLELILIDDETDVRDVKYLCR